MPCGILLLAFPSGGTSLLRRLMRSSRCLDGARRTGKVPHITVRGTARLCSTASPSSSPPSLHARSSHKKSIGGDDGAATEEFALHLRPSSRRLFSPYRRSTASLTTFPPSTTDSTPSLGAVEEELCRRIGSGEWSRALTLLHAQSSPFPVSVLTSQAAANNTTVTLSERCMWCMLWCGQTTAAWQLWRNLLAQPASPVSSPPSSVLLPACAAMASTSPRVLLLLALYIHTVEHDARRTRDMLLLLDMAMKQNDVTPRDAVESDGVWLRLFLLWLRCVSAARPTDAALASSETTLNHPRDVPRFYEEVVQCLTASVQADRKVDAEVAALLLWSLTECLVLDTPPSCAASFSRTSVSIAIVKEEVHRCMVSSSALSTNPVGSTHVDETAANNSTVRGSGTNVRQGSSIRSLPSTALEKGDADARERLLRRRVHDAVTRAAQQLTSRRAEGTTRNMSSSTEPSHDINSPHLQDYRFWCTQLFAVIGLHQTWAARQIALHHGHASLSSTSSLRTASGHATGAAAGSQGTRTGLSKAATQLLWRINRASDQRDWVAALQLCFQAEAGNGAPGNAPGENAATLPWVQRLRKGLTACEVAADFARGASWQGALALWRFAHAHRHSGLRAVRSTGEEATALAPPSSLVHEYGRIFMLLASATRWSDVLACFYATPSCFLDGFVVAQVCYALRAAADHHDWAVLELWATWRCRCGDTANPTAEMVHQLLPAMLHAAASSTPSASASVHTARTAAEVATGLLVAAAATTMSASTTEARSQRSHTTPRASTDALRLPLPGASVPLHWARQRQTVRRVFEDRWVGTWAAALQVALASKDARLLRTAATRAPPAHVPPLDHDMLQLLHKSTETAAPAERATLVAALWGNRPAGTSTDAVHGLAEGDGGGWTQRHMSATQRAELLLDELLGRDDKRQS